MSIKLRVVQYIIQPVIVTDDGDTLTPVEVAPITVTAAAFPGFPESFAAQLAEREAELNADGGK